MTGRTYRIGEAARLLKLEGYVLRHEQGMTIEGARRVLERECAESGDGKARTSAEDMLRHVESELMALQALLGRQRLKPTR